MNIEDIKKRFEGKAYKPYFGDLFEENKEYFSTHNDIAYLLSIIEQAKKALIVLADDENWNGRTKHNDFRTSGIIEWDGEISPLILAKEALKAIQGGE